ncbi:MAG: RHS repeat-associated core domain-containing protein [Candidatus Aenigmatarchaeota archaeon]
MAEKDGSGKIQKVYINDGEGIIGMVRYIYDSSNTFSHHQRLYYLYDSLGSVSAVADENGMPLQEYYYTPYGSTSNVERDPVNALQFIGRYGGYKDDDTGLTYFWHRWYDEGDGRWISRDPLGILYDLNLYRYSYNMPVNYIDKDGLEACPVPICLPKIPEKPEYRKCFDDCYKYYETACYAVAVACGFITPKGWVAMFASGNICYWACQLEGEKRCRNKCLNECGGQYDNRFYCK